MRRCIRPADDRLDQVRRVTTCLERRTSNLDEEPGRPGCLLRALDDDRVAGKYGGNDGSDDIMELRPLSSAIVSLCLGQMSLNSTHRITVWSLLVPLTTPEPGSGTLILPVYGTVGTYFQLTHAATTPKGSQRTSLTL